MRSHVAIGCLLVALSTPAIARADTPHARVVARQRAKVHAAEAEVHYKSGRFVRALEAYTKAYDLSPVPEVLFNLGQCHFQLKTYERALFFYRGYLRERPNAANRALVMELIAESEHTLDAQRRAFAVATPAAFEKRAEPEEQQDRAQPALYRRWWFWAAVGAAAITVGGTAYLMQSNDSSRALPDRSLGAIDLR